MNVDPVTVVWPLILGVLACIWAMRPRNTARGLAIEYAIFVALTALRFALDVRMLASTAALVQEPYAFRIWDIAYLLWPWVAVGIGLLAGWRLRPDLLRNEVQRHAAISLLAKIDEASTLDESIPILVDYFAIWPEGLLSAVSSLASLSRRDSSLEDLTASDIQRKLTDGGIEGGTAQELGLLLQWESSATCLTSAST